MLGDLFYNRYKFVNGILKPDTALSNASYPVSGSYVDTTGAIMVTILIHLGTIADALVFTVKSADSLTGTLDALSTTQTHTIDTDDDGEWVVFQVNPAVLAEDHHFLSVTITANSGSNYADIVYLLDYGALPLTQTTAVLPSASCHALMA